MVVTQALILPSGRRLQSGLGLLVFTFVCLGYLLIAIGVHTRIKSSDQQQQEPLHLQRQRRELKSNRDDPANNLVDILRLRPSVSQGRYDPLLLSTGSLSKEGAQKRVREVDALRQGLYLKLLRERGNLVDLPEGGSAIVSSANSKVTMPNSLKHREVHKWLPSERVWANLSHFPWPADEQCKTMGTSFARVFQRKEEELPLVALASYPGSGNTWLRYLIEGATGYFTGSMYADIVLKSEGYYGEGVPYNSGMTVAVKTHGFTTGDCSLNKTRAEQAKCNSEGGLVGDGRRVILLVRNPFDAIVSHRHLDSVGHQGYATEDQFLGEGWKHFVAVKIASWENFYLDWLRDSRPSDLLVLYFESLRTDLDRALRQILNFLRLKVDEKRLRCSSRLSEGLFRRSSIDTRGGVSPATAFTSEQREEIRAAIERVNRALRAMGKESLPVDKFMLYDSL